jgi:hypothetical protein
VLTIVQLESVSKAAVVVGFSPGRLCTIKMDFVLIALLRLRLLQRLGFPWLGTLTPEEGPCVPWSPWFCFFLERLIAQHEYLVQKLCSKKISTKERDWFLAGDEVNFEIGQPVTLATNDTAGLIESKSKNSDKANTSDKLEDSERCHISFLICTQAGTLTKP